MDVEALKEALAGLTERLPQVPARVSAVGSTAEAIEHEGEALIEQLSTGDHEAEQLGSEIHEALAALDQDADHHQTALDAGLDAVEDALTAFKELEADDRELTATAETAASTMASVEEALRGEIASLESLHAETEESVEHMAEMLTWAKESLGEVREAINTETEALTQRIELAQSLLDAGVASVASAVELARQSLDGVLATAGDELLPEFSARLEAMTDGFEGELRAALSDLTRDWQERLAVEVRARTEADVDEVRALLVSLAESARKSTEHWCDARDAAEPGFLEVDQKLAVLDTGVANVKETAVRIGLEW